MFFSLFSPKPGRSRIFFPEPLFSRSSLFVIPSSFVRTGVFFWPDASDLRKFQDTFRYLLFQVLKMCKLAGRQYFPGFSRARLLPTPGISSSFPTFGDARNIFPQYLDLTHGQPCGALARFELYALNVEDISDFIEYCRDLFVTYPGCRVHRCPPGNLLEQMMSCFRHSFFLHAGLKKAKGILTPLAPPVPEGTRCSVIA